MAIRPDKPSLAPQLGHKPAEALSLHISASVSDTLSLTRERVRVWVSGPLPYTRTHWRTRRIWRRGACGKLVRALSRELDGRGNKSGHTNNYPRSRGLLTVSGVEEGIQISGISMETRAAGRFKPISSGAHARTLR